MPAIWLKARFKGRKGSAEAEGLLNSGSDIVVLPEEIADRIDPLPVGKLEVELADGRIKESNAYEIDIEVENPDTGERRKARVLSSVEKRAYPLIGVEAMEKLRIVLDIAKGKASFA